MNLVDYNIWCLILNWNGIKHLEYMLPSILDCNYNNNTHFLLIDANSNDSSCDYAKSLNSKKLSIYKLNDNPGWAGANNKGIEYAVKHGADYVVLLNNDMRFSKNWLIDSMLIFDKYDDAGIVGCKIINSLDKFKKSNELYQKHDCNEVRFIPGCCMILPTYIFKNIGLINEEYIFYEEEVDFEHRVKKAGYKLYESNSPVWHHHDGSLYQFPEKRAYLAIRNSILISRRYDIFIITIAKTINIILCLVFKNYRKHTMTNKRYYAKNPLINIKIFIKAFHWNLIDIFKRGYKAKIKLPIMNEN